MHAPAGHPQASVAARGEVHRTLGARSEAMVRIARNLAEVRISLVEEAQNFIIADSVKTNGGYTCHLATLSS